MTHTYILLASAYLREAYTPTTLCPNPLTLFLGLRAIPVIATVRLSRCRRLDMFSQNFLV
jgi:hypothetical protein